MVKVSLSELLTQFSHTQIAQSIHIIKGHYFLRLYNSYPQKASIQALLASKSTTRELARTYSNIRPSRTDYINGCPCGNRKVDINIDDDQELALQLFPGIKVL